VPTRADLGVGALAVKREPQHVACAAVGILATHGREDVNPRTGLVACVIGKVAGRGLHFISLVIGSASEQVKGVQKQ
jgi:hypothetical protein